jgi:hypothetical protein
MSYRTRTLLALALASTLVLGMTLTARAQDFASAGISVNRGGSSNLGFTMYSGETTLGGGTLSLGDLTVGSVSSSSFALTGHDNLGSTISTSGSLMFNLGVPTIGALRPGSGGSISTDSTIVNSGIPYLTGGGVPPPAITPFAPIIPTLQANAVPEPSAIVLAIVAALGFVGLRRGAKLAGR